MIVFGGAGHENLLDDVWQASWAPTVAPAHPPTAAVSSPPLCWRLLRPVGQAPTARSSHICASWPAGAMPIMRSPYDLHPLCLIPLVLVRRSS